ncbi:hypothetical protein PVAND_014232 [Polypedilum vanderplanki]|uniref:Protein kinase domain-containing protein n=1 Tax=Polypedilum vanderplanki TaxID=319348 RepID=A0A9J6CSI2_POLVA|nr:hypothetical protein PVAND_014232 [Polypedilum vanderplanki]
MLDSLVRNYSLLCKIGEGSFSEVLKVKEKISGQMYAAKRLTRTFLNLEEVEEYAELKIFKKLEYHPNVLSLVEYVYETDTRILSLIFNLMDLSLYDYIKDRKRKLSELRCKNFLYQLTNGLQYLHKNEIFHRDIKPENILLRFDEQLQKSNPLKAELVQIGDLGSVAFTSDSGPRTEYVSTRWYRSPECLLTSGFYGPKMDVWAVGCCFYEMLTLQPLFPGDNEVDQLDKIHNVIGTPSAKVLKMFKGLAIKYEFPQKRSVNWFHLLPSLSSLGIDAIKRMLNYLPDNRISAKKLIDHPYFNDLREKMNYDNVSTRLLFTRSASNSIKNSTTSLGTSKGIKSQSFVCNKSSNNSRQSIDMKNFQIEMQKCLNKQLERNWNKPNSGMKRTILSNIKSSFKSTQRTLDQC